MTKNYIGVDISKNWIDVFHPIDGNSQIKMIKSELHAFAQTLNENDIIILEATGGYEQPLLDILEGHNLYYHRANPARARQFSQAIGRRAKTDQTDAQTLSVMGECLDLKPTKPLSEAHKVLKSLITRRRQLIEMNKQEKTRLKQCQKIDIQENIKSHSDYLRAQIKMIEQKITNHIKQTQLKDKAQLLQSIPGIGPVVATTLIAEMPELGQVDRRAIASLAGLAPLSKESGKRQGKRQIGKSRPHVTALMYLAALQASRRAEAFIAIRKKLEAKGKTPKQAIIAIARKLITIANAIIKTNQMYKVKTL